MRLVGIILRSFILLACGLLVVACSGGKAGSPFILDTSSGPRPRIVMEMASGETVELKLATSVNKDLAAFFLGQVQRGYYNNQLIYRQLPDSFVLTGKARLSGRPTVAGPFVPEDDDHKLPEVGFGEFGFVKHVDHTNGPELVLMYGTMLRDRAEVPENAFLGSIVSGRDTLQKMEKGDSVRRVYIQQNQ